LAGILAMKRLAESGSIGFQSTMQCGEHMSECRGDNCGRCEYGRFRALFHGNTPRECRVRYPRHLLQAVAGRLGMREYQAKKFVVNHSVHDRMG
jgi:hypothetical protein